MPTSSARGCDGSTSGAGSVCPAAAREPERGVADPDAGPGGRDEQVRDHRYRPLPACDEPAVLRLVPGQGGADLVGRVQCPGQGAGAHHGGGGPLTEEGDARGRIAEEGPPTPPPGGRPDPAGGGGGSG